MRRSPARRQMRRLREALALLKGELAKLKIERL